MTINNHLIHIATMLVVSSIEKSIAFYTGNLGFTLQEQENHIALLKNQGMLLYLVRESEPTPDKPGVSLANLNSQSSTSVNLVFRVDDCRKVYQELLTLGARFLAPPHPPKLGWLEMFSARPRWVSY